MKAGALASSFEVALGIGLLFRVGALLARNWAGVRGASGSSDVFLRGVRGALASRISSPPDT